MGWLYSYVVHKTGGKYGWNSMKNNLSSSFNTLLRFLYPFCTFIFIPPFPIKTANRVTSLPHSFHGNWVKMTLYIYIYTLSVINRIVYIFVRLDLILKLSSTLLNLMTHREKRHERSVPNSDLADVLHTAEYGCRTITRQWPRTSADPLSHTSSG
jgi:hypothetical protein